MALTKKAISRIKRDSNLRAKLMLVPYNKATGKGVSEYTIRRWLEDKDDALTMPKYTEVIAEHTKLPLSEILE